MRKLRNCEKGEARSPEKVPQKKAKVARDLRSGVIVRQLVEPIAEENNYKDLALNILLSRTL